MERHQGVVSMTIDRPERRNALDAATFGVLRDELRAVAARPEDRVVVVTGAGDAFCAGGDLRSGPPPRREGDTVAAPDPHPATASPAERTLALMRGPIGEAALALHQLPQPTIAAVNGVAAGAGANLAFGCDLVLAAASARFGQLFIRRGLSLDFGGTWLLPRLVGVQQAKRLALLGDWVDATAAAALGLVTEVWPDAELAARAAELAARLAAQPPLAMALIKANLNQSFGLSMAEALELEATSQAACTLTEEYAAAREAFRRSAPS